MIYWLGKVKDINTQVVLSNEHQDYKWLKLDEAIVLGKYKEMTDVLIQCDNYIKNNK